MGLPVVLNKHAFMTGYSASHWYAHGLPTDMFQAYEDGACTVPGSLKSSDVLGAGMHCLTMKEENSQV